MSERNFRTTSHCVQTESGDVVGWGAVVKPYCVHFRGGGAGESGWNGILKKVGGLAALVRVPDPDSLFHRLSVWLFHRLSLWLFHRLSLWLNCSSTQITETATVAGAAGSARLCHPLAVLRGARRRVQAGARSQRDDMQVDLDRVDHLFSAAKRPSAAIHLVLRSPGATKEMTRR